MKTNMNDDSMKQQTSRLIALSITTLFIATGFFALMPAQNETHLKRCQT